MKFQHQSRAITLLKMNEKYCSIIQIYILSISMHIDTKFNRILQINSQDIEHNKILTSIKGHNSVKNWPKITCIRYNMDLVFINAFTKFIKIHPFVLKILRKILRKNTFLHQSRAITLLFINEFSPFTIPNHSFLISMSMQSLKNISPKLLKLESGNDIFTSIKSHNTVVYKRIQSICNPKSLLPDINVHAKFKENRSKLTRIRVRKRRADGRTDRYPKFKNFRRA